MQDQVSIHLPDRSFITCHYKTHVKEILHFFQELIAIFHISNWNLCLIASTPQCTGVAELLWGFEVVTAQTCSCPLTWCSHGACCTVPHGVVEMWPRTQRKSEEKAGPDLLPSPQGWKEWISDNRADLKQLHTYGACEPQAASCRATGVCAAGGKSRVGRCLSMPVPQHGAAGTHHEQPWHGRAKLGPTPAAVWDASASDESKVN